MGGFHHRVALSMTGRQNYQGLDSVWVYPPLESVIEDAVLQEVDTYVSRQQKKSHSLLQPGPLWICVWCRSWGRNQWWPISGGSSTDWIWKVLRTADWEAKWGGGGGRDGWDKDGDRLSQWGNNVEHITLGTERNVPLVYAPGFEHHHPIMSILWGLGSWLERERKPAQIFLRRMSSEVHSCLVVQQYIFKYSHWWPTSTRIIHS